MSKLIIRPSSVDTFQNCSHQWYRTHILGENSIPNARASIGTAIHKAAEVLWTEAIATKKKDANLAKITQAALDSYKEEEQKGLVYNDGENSNTAVADIVRGSEAFVTDIVPFTDIPRAVEQRYTIAFKDHPVVESLSGTVDYVTNNQISDIKTSMKAPTVGNYTTQQSLYKLLAVANKVPVEFNTIQSITFNKTKTVGRIMDMPTNMEAAKLAVNVILDVTEIYAKDIISPDMLFRGNNKYYLCSNKYCAFYNDCKFVAGTAKQATENDIKTVAKHIHAKVIL